jgi:long-chain acyl-CoA synthetase
MVIGEGQAYLSAIIVLNNEEWITFASKHVVDPYQAESLNDPRIQHEVLNRCRKLLHEFPGYAKIRRVILTLEPWSVDNGLLTPTLKVKRPRVLAAYKDAIANLYNK